MIHELKTWPAPFIAIANGRKRHELRKADRDFREGDILRLREWDPGAWGADAPESNTIGNGKYTGLEVYVEVTYMTPAGNWGLPAELCCLSIRLLTPEQINLVLGAEKAGAPGPVDAEHH